MVFTQALQRSLGGKHNTNTELTVVPKEQKVANMTHFFFLVKLINSQTN